MTDEFLESLVIPEEFWEETAKWIEEVLKSEKVPEAGTRPFLKYSLKEPPDHPPWNESHWRKSRLLGQFTSAVAEDLLRQKAAVINIKDVEQQTKLERLGLKNAAHKLSKLQKQILIELPKNN